MNSAHSIFHGISFLSANNPHKHTHMHTGQAASDIGCWLVRIWIEKKAFAIKWYIKSLWLFCNGVRQRKPCKIHERYLTNECAKIQNRSSVQQSAAFFPSKNQKRNNFLNAFHSSVRASHFILHSR